MAGARRFVRDRVREWRSGSSSSQRFVLGVLLALTVISFLVSWNVYAFMPLTGYFVWLLAGMLTLRFSALAVLALAAFTSGFAGMLHDGPMTANRVAAVCAWLICAALILVHSSLQRTGLPLSLTEAMLIDLRDRLQSQGQVPPLPDEWRAQSAMLSAQGLSFAGDFLVADLSPDRRHLEMVLVDVCGKGVAAGAQALHFAGALGGLLGQLAQPQLFHAANAFLLRQHADESFATAVHLRVDLATGAYSVTNAGHPPALRWDSSVGQWVLDSARGTALGIIPDPDLDSTHGVLAPGEALLFYTDGVVESRSEDLEVGISWLQETARVAVGTGYADAPRRIVQQVQRGDDDRAVLVLSRGNQPSYAPRTADDADDARIPG